jgi:hypothetical protein
MQKADAAEGKVRTIIRLKQRSSEEQRALREATVAEWVAFGDLPPPSIPAASETYVSERVSSDDIVFDFVGGGGGVGNSGSGQHVPTGSGLGGGGGLARGGRGGGSGGREGRGEVGAKRAEGEDFAVWPDYRGDDGTHQPGVSATAGVG